MKFYSEYLFPSYYDRFMLGVIEEEREAVISQAKGITLEVGIGTGLNLPFYSGRVTQLHAVDPNPGMEKQLRKKVDHLPFPFDFYLSGAEALPFPDNHFDTVLSTLVLCSLPQLDLALTEIHRVLKPGGLYLFLEHGLAPPSGTRFFQHLCNPIQRLCGDGCRLTVPINDEIEKSPLRLESLDRYYKKGLPKILGYFYKGNAVK